MNKSTENTDIFAEVLHLGRQLRQTLDPVAASPIVVERVRAQLDANVENAKQAVLTRRTRRKRTAIAAAVIGVIVYSLGLALVVYRLAKRFLLPKP